jgi:hypothetical protein
MTDNCSVAVLRVTSTVLSCSSESQTDQVNWAIPELPPLLELLSLAGVLALLVC